MVVFCPLLRYDDNSSVESFFRICPTSYACDVALESCLEIYKNHKKISNEN